MSYTQKIVPEVKIDFQKYSSTELRKKALDIFKKNINGKLYYNHEINVIKKG